MGRKRRLDESMLSPDEARKREERRASNRQAAAKARQRTKKMILELERRVDNLRKETRALKRDAKQLSRQFEQAILQNQMFQHSMQNTPKRMVATGIPFDYRGPAVSQNCWASTGFSASSAMSSAGDVLTCFPTKLEIAIAECGTVNGVLDISLRLSLLKCLRDERLATAARIRRAELDGTHQEG